MLQHLENNEAILLMYLADELPAEDRAEVEQQLAADAGLRVALERLRETTDALTRVLTEADGVAIPSASEAARRSAAVRRVSRAMVKARVERESAETAAAAAAAAAQRARSPRLRRLRIPGWAYPLATAAMVLIAWVAYWGFTKPAGTDGVDEQRATAGRSDYLRAVAAMQSFDADTTDRQAMVSAVNAEDAEFDLGSLVRAVAASPQQEPTSEPSEQ